MQGRFGAILGAREVQRHLNCKGVRRHFRCREGGSVSFKMQGRFSFSLDAEEVIARSVSASSGGAPSNGGLGPRLSPTLHRVLP
eukprot:574903-Pelagomonas_calceolata.AAC.2